MAGTRKGGLKAKYSNWDNDPDFYRKIGAKGGAVSRGGGFASKKIGKDGLTGKSRAVIAGAKGGTISKRRPKS